MASRILSLALFASMLAGCHSQKQITRARSAPTTLVAWQLRPYGRSAMTPEGLELISTAVHFGFSFKGSACELFVSVPQWLDHNYLQYEMDGVYQKRIRVEKGGIQTITLPANGNGKHTVWIYKATEAQTGPLFIQKVVAPDARVILPATASLIEFIGNSITCGAAADASEIPCNLGAYHDHHNAYMAYGPRVARALGANYVVSSVSGIGVYRNWNSEGPTMPQVYEHTGLRADDGRMWDFSQYQPKVVSIALGTNDFSGGDGKTPRLPFDSALFIGNYVRFIQLVKSKYPQAQIALLSSPMMNGDNRILLQNCLATVKAEVDRRFPGDRPVALFFFSPMQPGGCAGHPSVEDHGIMAQELLPFFKGLLR